MNDSHRFEPIRRLGGGEYCEVHLCWDDEHDDETAVKWFRLKHRKVARQIKKGKLGFSSNLRAAFLDEIALTAGFDHPNIVQVLNSGGLDASTPSNDGKNSKGPSGPSDDAPWFAMPFHPTDLAQALWGRSIPRPLGTPIAPDRGIRLLEQIFKALKEIHAQGVVHRDIKPQNVLLDASDNAVVCDFGHALNPNANAPLGKNRYGTAPFVAPEQRADPDSIDGRADIYALGALGYLLFTGQRIATEQTPHQTYEIDATIDKGIKDWIAAALSTNPAKRPIDL